MLFDHSKCKIQMKRILMLFFILMLLDKISGQTFSVYNTFYNGNPQKNIKTTYDSINEATISDVKRYLVNNIYYDGKVNCEIEVNMSINKDGKVFVTKASGNNRFYVSRALKVFEDASKVNPILNKFLLPTDTSFLVKILFSINKPRSFFEPNTIEKIYNSMDANEYYKWPGQDEYNRGIYQMEIKNYENALESFNTAVSKKFQHIELLFARSIAYINLNKPDSADKDIKLVMQINPERFKYRIHDSLNYKGFEYINNQQFDLAIPMFNLSLKYFPTDTNTLYYRAVSYLKTKKTLDAIEDLDEAIEAGCKNAQTLVKNNFSDQKLAVFYYQLVKKYSEKSNYYRSLIYLDKIITLFPNMGQTYLTKADILIKLGNKHDACYSCKKAIELGTEVNVEEQKKYCE
jgi:tetratricopeptide (TPR) repeat protein